MIDDAGLVARRELARHRIHHRFRFANQLRELLRHESVGLRARRPHRQLLVMQRAGIRAQLEQGFVELLVMQFVDEGGVGFAQRVVDTAFSLAPIKLIHREEG